MYNCVTTALRSNEKVTDIWITSEASQFQRLFNPYQKQYPQRLAHQLSAPRVIALSTQELQNKCFVLQKLEDASIFLDSDITRYKALNMNYENNNNPSTTEDLLKFQELILLDIRFLAGCDINWDYRDEAQRKQDAPADKAKADKAKVDKPKVVKAGSTSSLT